MATTASVPRVTAARPLCASLLLVAGACGARTELEALPRDGAVAAMDARAVLDAPADSPRDTPPPPPPDAAPPVDVSGVTCCADGVNAQGTPADGCGGAGGTWAWVATCSFTVRRIEMHTTATRAALYADGGDRPGAMLAAVTLGPRDADGWARGTFATPVTVQAGRRYWIEQGEGTCSIAASGVAPEYWVARGGTWEGPYHWLLWMARLSDNTCP